MPVFDVSFLNPKLKRSGGSGYNIGVDQLSILEKQLEVDGKLSSGDYDYLIKEAVKLQGAPGLTADQRSNVTVRIAGYRRDRSTDGIKDTEDIERLNRNVNDDFRQATVLTANDPKKLLQIRSDALRVKVNVLSDSINRLDEAGDDSSKHLGEYNSALNELKDTLEAQRDSEAYKPGAGKPSSEFVAYVTTNNKGEISDVQFGRVGKSGYSQTNGLYGGLQVYGKVNAKESGQNVFLMGGQRFTAPDNLLPGPDGTFTSSPLIAESVQRGGKSFKSVSGTPYVDFDLVNLRGQSAIDPGGWALGDKNTLYQKQADGSYKKYINVKQDQYPTLGITDNNLFKIPRVLEQGIATGVRETIDGAGGIGLPPIGRVQYDQPIGPTPAPSATPVPTPLGVSRTPSPVERSPKSTQGYAAKALGSAKSFLGSLFGNFGK